MKMIKYFKITKYALLIVMLNFFGCQTQEIVAVHEHKQLSSKNLISYKDFKRNTNLNDDELILKIESANFEANARLNYINEFIIDTTAITNYIASNNKSTYSFRVYPKTNQPLQNEMYNLIYNKENNAWNKTLISFDKNVVSGKIVFENFDNLFQSNDNSTMSTGEICTNTHSFIDCDGSCAREGYSTCDGFGCPTGQCVTTVSTIVACANAGGGPSEPGQNPIPPVNIAINPQDPFSFIPNIYNNPVFDDANYVNTINATHFFNNLHDSKKMWIYENQLNTEVYLNIIQYQIVNEWSAESTIFSTEMISILQDLSTNNENVHSLEILSAVIYAKNNNYLNSNLDSTFFSAQNSNSSLNLIDPTTAINFARMFLAHCAVLRSENPTWSNYKIFATAYLDTIHLLLDFAGLVPAFGEVADISNGVIYTIQGQGTNAALSYASAVPIAGWFSAGVKFAKRADGLRFLVVGTNNLIHFGAANSAKFRALCGLVPGDITRQAHHLIPRGSALLKHEVVQRAAKATTNGGFHIDSAINALGVATWRNQPNHNAYNTRIYNKLQVFLGNFPNATPNQCYDELTNIIQEAQQAIIDNPTVHLNDLIF